MPPVRRLTAILAADVAGYSRLMGADEEGTHERLQAHLRELVNPKITEHRGRIVKNTGDGLLAEFPSVVDAVRCAAEVQRGMIDREPRVRLLRPLNRPSLEYNGALKSFFGGNFWDSRSTGYKLGNPDAEQAQHPPVDPNEHGFPDTACIA